MTYPAPTVAQLLIIATAMIAPLVWAFTHHGSTRKTTLLFWVPLFIFVTRVVYLTPSPTAPLKLRLESAMIDTLMDPLTILWPAFVFVIYFLIWLFTAPRRRREAKVRQAATGAELAVAAARRQPPTPQASA